MTPEQFDVLAKLLRSRDPAREAARLVLVEGKTNAEAHAITGVLPQGIGNALARYRAADREIRAAYMGTSQKTENKAR